MSNSAAVKIHPFRVLVIKPSSLGDIIHALPAVELLLQHYPQARIDWLVHPAFAEALQYCRNLTRVIIFPRQELGKAKTFLPHFLRLSRELRRRRYDLVVDFQGLMRSAFFGRLTRTRRFAGFANPKEPIARIFYREKVKVPMRVHAVEKNLDFVAGLLNVEVPAAFRFPVLPPNPDAARRAAALLRQNGLGIHPLLGIIPGARWETKRWPETFFAAVIDRVAEALPDLRFVMLGAPAENAAAEKIRQLVKSPDRIVSLTGKTSIAELTEVIRQTVGLLTNDSGPMHIAAALQVPVFALFGPTDPAKTGPWGPGHFIFQPDLDCRGCLKRECPRGDARCHQMLDPQTVAEAIYTKINGGKPCLTTA